MADVWDVMKVLGENKRSVGSLCISDKINKWSFCKPIARQQYGPLTEQDYFDENDGFENLEYTSVVNLKEAIVNGTMWRYQKAVAPYYRLRDFDGYNHNARPFFRVSIVGYDYGGMGDTINMENEGRDWQWLFNFHYLRNAFGGSTDPLSQFGILDFGFFVWKENGAYFHKRSDVALMSDVSNSFRVVLPVSSGHLPNGVYRVLPVFRSHDSRIADNGWVAVSDYDVPEMTYYPVPCSPLTIRFDFNDPQLNPIRFLNVKFTNVRVTTIGESKTVNADVQMWIDASYPGGSIQMLNLTIYATNVWTGNQIKDIEIGNIAKNEAVKPGEKISTSISYTKVDSVIEDSDETSFNIKMGLKIRRDSGFGGQYTAKLNIYDGTDEDIPYSIWIPE